MQRWGIPAAKRARYALALPKDPVTGNPNVIIHHSTDKTQKWESGGGGTVSTATDYLRFAEMLRSGGKLGAAEVLGRGTVALMTADHLPASFNNMIADKMDPAATGYGVRPRVLRHQDGIAAMAGSASGTGRASRHLFLGRPQGAADRRLHGRRARSSPALPPDDAQPRVSGATLRIRQVLHAQPTMGAKSAVGSSIGRRRS
jgi:CubicO group peptidase (beta-lactamase class C family)